MSIKVIGMNLHLPRPTEERLRARVERVLAASGITADEAVLHVHEDANHGLSCHLELHVSTRLQLRIRESGAFLNPAVDAACEQAATILQQLERAIARGLAASRQDPRWTAVNEDALEVT